MPGTVPKDLLAQVLEFISKQQDMLLHRWERYDEQGDELADFVLHESMGIDTIKWYLTDEKYRADMNKIFEITE